MANLQWLSIVFAAFLLGMAKAGIKGVGILIVVLFAFVFEEKSSSGILLSLLVFADIMAVVYYNRHAKWNFIFKLLPWMVVGVLVGVWVGNDISSAIFKKMMATIIIASVFMMFYFEKKQSVKIPNNLWFSSLAGFLAGFTTMIGNLAGPISNVYFLAMRLPKNEFIGTAAWLFFMINVFKLPFHIFVWKTIDKNILALNLVLFPVILLGFYVGVKVVKQISNVNYRKFILFITALGGFILLLK